MIEENQLAQFKSLVENAQSVVVVLPENARIDELTTALGLQLALREMGKESRLAAVTVPVAQSLTLPGFDQIATELGNQNLTISFDYNEERVDKVSYHIGEETKKFYLTIKPRSGAQPLDTSSVEFAYTGASADLILYVGVNSLENLQQLYFGYEDLYKDASSISLNRNPVSLGQLQLTLSEESSLCELVAAIFTSLQFPVPADAATNWLTGIEQTTKGLSRGRIQAGTFEVIAGLLRVGGQRQPYADQAITAKPTKNGAEINLKASGGNGPTQINSAKLKPMNGKKLPKKSETSVMTG